MLLFGSIGVLQPMRWCNGSRCACLFQLPSGGVPNRVPTPSRWQPLELGNYDAALFPQDTTVGYGFIFGDHHGNLLREKHGRMHEPKATFDAEVLSHHEALIWC